jgi:hypothetical protein
MPIPEDMRWLFWDVDPDAIDLERDGDWVLARVLEHGRLPDVKWALRSYGRERILRFFEESGHPGLSRRTLAFWKTVFGTEGETWRTPSPFRTNSSAPWP